jgi:hypothetical protein
MKKLADQIKQAFSALGACRTLVVDSENRPRRGRFLPDSPQHGCSMVQEAGKKGSGAVDLQPTIPKSDRLLANADIGEWSGRREMHAALFPPQPDNELSAVPAHPATTQKWIALGVGDTLPPHVMVYVIGACRRMRANLLLISLDAMRVRALLADYLPDLQGITCVTEELASASAAAVLQALNLHHSVLFAVSGAENDPLRPLLRARRNRRSPVPIVLVTPKPPTSNAVGRQKVAQN